MMREIQVAIEDWGAIYRKPESEGGPATSGPSRLRVPGITDAKSLLAFSNSGRVREASVRPNFVGSVYQCVPHPGSLPSSRR